MTVHKLAYKQLVEFFDVLRPVLMLDLTCVRYAYDKFLSLTGVVDLDEFDSTIESCLEYFPDTVKEVKPIILLLSQEKIMLGKRIYLLDVMTTLCILVRGNIKEKAQLLFKWYNFSKTNQLSELEHTLLIIRASECLHRLRLMGLIEMSRDDARHIALSARVVLPKDNSKITFIPGLSLSEFTSWVENGKQGQSIVLAFRILEKLSDTLVALQRKASALYNVVERKRLHGHEQLQIPSKEILKASYNPSPVHIIYRGESMTSALITTRLFRFAANDFAYVQIKELVAMDIPLFEYPPNTKFRVFNGRTLPSQCCHKYYELISNVKVPIITYRNATVARVDIPNLFLSSSYLIEIYTEHEWYRQVKLAPGGASSEIAICEISVQSPDNAEDNDNRVCIFPATVRLPQAAQLLLGNQDVQKSTTLIYTGSLCSIDDILSSAAMQQLVEVDAVESRRFADAMQGLQESRYQSALTQAIDELYGLTVLNSAPIDDSLYDCVTGMKHQVIYYNGMGPWGSPVYRRDFQKALGHRNAHFVLDRMEDVYGNFIAPVLGPRFSLVLGHAKIFWVRDPSMPLRDKDKDEHGFSGDSASLLRCIQTFIDLDSKLSTVDEETIQPDETSVKLNDLVIICRSPVYLLQHDIDWGIYTNDNDAAVEEAKAAHTAKLKAERQKSMRSLPSRKLETSSSADTTKLRGKHELIHGEYSAGAVSNSDGLEDNEFDAAKVPKEDLIAPDEVFSELIVLLLKWIQYSDKRSVTIVSVGWEEGFNFEIVQRVSVDDRPGRQSVPTKKSKSRETSWPSSFIKIRHINLLPTGTPFVAKTQADLAPKFVKKPKMVFDEETKKWFKVPSSEPPPPPPTRTYPRSNHRILRRIQRSVAGSVDFNLLPGSSTHRGIFFGGLEEYISIADEVSISGSVASAESSSEATFGRSSSNISASGSIVSSNENPESTVHDIINSKQKRQYHFKITDITVEMPKGVNSDVSQVPPVRILTGPILKNIDRNSVVATSSAVGTGFVMATLFELPMHTSRDDAIAFMSTENRLSLTVTSSLRIRILDKRNFYFKFSDLMPNCCYCILLEPYSEVPLVSQFRTLNSDIGSSTSSCIVAGYTFGDEIQHGAVVKRLGDLCQGWRISSRTLHLIREASTIPNDFVDHLPRYLHKKLPGVARFSALENKAIIGKIEDTQLKLPLVHSPSELSPALSDLVQVVFNNKFCRITPRSDQSECLLAATLAVNHILVTVPDLKNILLVVHRPLIRYLRRYPNGSWLCDGPAYSHRRLCLGLLCALLAWKLDRSGRDCQIVSTVDIVDWKVATICFQHHHLEGHKHHHPVLAHSSRQDRQHHKPGIIDRSHRPIHFDGDSSVHSEHSHFSYHSLRSVEAAGHKHKRKKPSVSAKDHIKDDNFGPDEDVLINEAVSIRHLLLPRDLYFGKFRKDQVIFPHGVCKFGDKICYAVENSPNHEEKFVHLEQPKGIDLIPKTTSPQPLVYIIDVVLDSDEITSNFPKEKSKAAPVEALTNHHEGNRSSVSPPDRLIPSVEVVPDVKENKSSILPRSDVISSSLSMFYNSMIKGPTVPVIPSAAPQMPEEVVEEKLAEMVPVSVPRRIGTSSMNSIICKQYLREQDFFDIVFGPVIGLVTSKSAVVSVELSRSVSDFRCLVRRIGDKSDPGIALSQSVTAYKVCVYKFSGLEDASIYEIYFPDFEAGKVFGYFRTHDRSPQYCELVVTGEHSLKGLPILDDVVNQLESQMVADLQHLRTMRNFLHGANVAFSDEAEEIGQLSKRQARNKIPNSWMKLSEHLRHPSMLTSAVFHLGSTSLLAQHVTTLARRLLGVARKLQLPVRDANAVGSLYFHQFEEFIKDSFRLMLSTPSIRDALSVGCHLPSFTADVLLPLDKMLNAELLKDEVAAKHMQVIRKVFETQYLAYIAPLYDLPLDAAHHSRVWRMGSMAMVVLDIASDRRKVKKKKLPGEDADGAPSLTDAPKATKQSSNPFSAGFIEKIQWKFLKEIASDPSVVQMFICTQYPIVSLKSIPSDFESPEDIPKGDILEWSPTVNDLDIFLQYWIEWMLPTPLGEHPPSRSVAFISESPIPHVTILQDMPTGLSMKQLSVGNFNGNPSDLPSNQNLRMTDIEIQGRIGTIRYLHQFENLDNVRIDSARNAMDSGLESKLDLLQLAAPNFAVLKFWFDSWKPSGLWAVSPTVGSKSLKDKDATMILGPILGAPYLVSPLPTEEMMMVPVLVELDRDTIISIEAVNVFGGFIQSWTVQIAENTPKIFVLGPFELESRYSIRFTRGITAAANYGFVVDTFINWSETNIAVMNCISSRETIPCSDMMRDLVNHGRVPFSGLTTTVQTNLQPSDIEIEYIKKSAVLKNGLASCRSSGHLSPAFKHFLIGLLSSTRQLFRNLLSRPSYRELFKTTFNLFVFMGKSKPMVPKPPAQAPEQTVAPTATTAGNNRNSRSPTPTGAGGPRKGAKSPAPPPEPPPPTAEEIEAQRLAAIAKAAEDAANDDTDLFVNWLIFYVNEEYLGGLKKFSYDFEGAQEIIRNTFIPAGSQLPKRPGSSQKAMQRVPDPATESLIDEIFGKWLNKVPCTPPQWVPWISPNGLLSIECVDTLSPTVSQEAVVSKILQEPIPVGNRIFFMTNDNIMADGDLGESDIGQQFSPIQNAIVSWVHGRVDRKVCVICPCTHFGTREMFSTDQPLSVPLYYLDSIFRSNERELERTLLARSLTVKTQVQAYSTGKSKTALKKKEEEFKRLMQLQREQVLRSFERANPDGYFLIECQTSMYESAQQGLSDVLSSFRLTVMGTGATEEQLASRPTSFDYIQMPVWLQKFIPNRDGPFIQDEIWLTMMNDDILQKVVERFESDDVRNNLKVLYEGSRLSELSRPADMREVDMSIPGVIELFTTEIFKRIQNEIIPNDLLKYVMPVDDDFVRSVLLSRTLADLSPLNSPETFADTVQQCLILSVAMKLSYNSRNQAKWQFIRDAPEKGVGIAVKLVEKEKRLLSTIARAKVRNPTTFDQYLVENEFNELEDSIEELHARTGGELDMVELLREEMIADMEAERAIIRSDMERREQELQAIENDRLEMAANNAGGEQSKVEQLAQLKQEKMAFDKILEESFNTGFENLIEEIFNICLEPVINEFQREAQLTITMSLMGGQESEEDKRIREAKMHQTTLHNVRVELRRRLGARFTYLSMKIT